MPWKPALDLIGERASNIIIDFIRDYETCLKKM